MANGEGRRAKGWLLFFLTMALLSGCDAVAPQDQPEPPRALTAEEATIVEADNAFGLSLFTHLHEAEPAENLFISPLSVSMALGMTLNGAAGDTRDQMARALHKEGLTEEAINASYRSLIDLLTGLDPKVTLNIANSIWYREGFQVEPAFIETNRTHFDAEVQALDFTDPQSVDVINGWVEDKTEGLIDAIIDQIGQDVVMYLINAVYFNGQWTYAFEKEETTDQPFFNADGTQTTVPMMSLSGPIPYANTDEAGLIDLPYGDSLYSMTIVLPHDPDRIEALAGALSSEKWNEWTAQLRPVNLTVNLPRLSLEYKTSLADALAAMGMTDAFSPARADFSRINPNRQLYVSDVLHKTMLKVDEEGTEAAAVTAVIVETTSITQPPVFRVDRPFLLAIRERHTGSILFIGKVMGM